MVQYARPDADDTDGNWTDKSGGSTLYTSIDDTSADDDTTYIKVTDNGSNETCTVRLSDVDTPDAGNAYIRIKAKTSDNAFTGNPPQLKWELLEGSTVRATATFTSVSTSGWGDRTSTFNGLAISVSDWSNLKLRLTMMAGDGGGMGASDEMHVTIAYLETQDAASASVPIAAIAHNTYQQLRTP